MALSTEYTPHVAPAVDTEDGKALALYLEREFQAIARRLVNYYAVDLRSTHSAPLRPTEGMVVFADGTDWNPGSGKGLYVYISAAWKKVTVT